MNRFRVASQWGLPAFCFLFTVLIGFQGYYFWNQGFFDSTKHEEITSAYTKIEKLRERNLLKDIKSHVDNDQISLALGKSFELEEKVKELNKVLKGEEGSVFVKNAEAIQTDLRALKLHTGVRSLLSVLADKVKTFESYAEKNNWRTLTRISARIKTKVADGKLLRSRFFHLNKVKVLHKAIASDLNLMRTVTKGSILRNSQKASILNRIKNLEVEVIMLENYVVKLTQFNKNYHLAMDNFNQWFSHIEPQVTDKKMQLERSGQNFVISYFGLFVLSLIGLVFSLMWMRKEREKLKARSESFVLEQVKTRLLSDEFVPDTDFSESFNENLRKVHEYLDRRMSFGNLFHEGSPFPSVLLDSNLNLVWANDLFFENFHLQHYKDESENLSWDFIQRFTNIGENDPVQDSLKNNVAGIYQVQVHLDDKKEQLPYEMYVSPLMFKNQKRIMIFFYPLQSLQQTIQDQIRSIVGPIKRTIDSWKTRQFKGRSRIDLQKDFKIAGIEPLFNQMEDFYDNLEQERADLHGELGRRSDELQESFARFDQIHRTTSMLTEDIKQLKISLNALKNSFVEGIEKRELQSSQMNRIFGQQKNLSRTTESLITYAGDMERSLSQVTNSIDRLTEPKNNLAEIGSELVQLRLMFKQVFQDKSSSLEDKTKLVEKHLSELGQLIATIQKTLKTFDVSFSKISLSLEKTHYNEKSAFQDKFNLSHASLSEGERAIEEVTRQLQQIEEEIVLQLRESYELINQQSVRPHEIQGALAPGDMSRQEGEGAPAQA